MIITDIAIAVATTVIVITYLSFNRRPFAMFILPKNSSFETLESNHDYCDIV